ncbi:zinc ABC transporter substrate-binding protein [Halorubrum sp. Boch-26]|uniref:metal ABC transporter solute-binding protein, Zn/Mn family n=1 Tax=Halorubrum sp. Boch-26 TaxID=2994426 RepID=UPI002468491A|nr:zinc ABC transporter substrate-binding protein [Halorubrum sp. Boch-26]
MSHSRRSVLTRGAGLLAAGAATSIAGCSGAADGEAAGFDGGYAAFFTLNDWANEVVGDRASFENPVEVGRLGHGWTPDGTLAADVASTDAFVYLDSLEFAWAQDLAATLEADYDSVAVVDALADVGDDLLDWDRSHEGEGERDGHEGEGDEHDEDTRDDRQYDPHVWVDPVLAARMVETIATGLGEADPENADAYAANATAYGEELAAVDSGFESIAADADRDVAVIAGHNSFQYLEARYGFRLHSPVGVSPQNEPSQSQIADTIELVNAAGIDTVLYDRFESTTLAETVVENSDATEMRAVSPAGGTTEEWNDAGYGYLEQMTEVNLPAFERAFGVQ